MKQKILWLLCLLFTANLFAQDEKLELFTLKHETFDKDDNTWTKSDSKAGGDSLAISDGYFYWRSQSPRLLQLARAATRLSERREHTITTRIIRQSLQNEHRIMLLFGYGSGDYWAVAIKRGDFQITGKVDGLTRELTPYKKSAAVREDTNDIRVHHRISQVDFYINEKLVYSHPKPLKYAADGVGFAQSGNGNMRIDFLKVEQWDTPIRILPDADLFGDPERLSENINTEYPDYVPIISHDGQTLYFIRRDAPYIMTPINKSDIFTSPLLPDGSWGEAVQLDTPINNQYNNAVCTVMPDNNTLYLLNQYKRDGIAQGLSLTQRGKDGWEYPINQVIDNYVNKSKYADMFVTSNGKVMILALEMLETEGERDLYVSFLLSPNHWSTPQNMGKTLNTIGSDFGPYLAADGKSLYFSSTGHAGYGSADVFVSRRLDDSWLNWSAPYNLGNKVNTPNFDAYYTIPAKGDYAYYVSNTPDNRADIFRIRLSPMARPEQTVIVEGYVKDSKTKLPVSAEISYESLTKEQELGIARPRVKDGYYQIMLTFGEHYGIMATADGYFPTSAEVDLKAKKQEKTDDVLRIRRDLYLSKLEKNAAIRLNNLFFDSNKYELLPASVTELQRLIVLLERNPTLTIQLEGHTDDQGTDAANKILSERRVQAVRSFLIDKKIKAERLKFVGYGESKPIVKNVDEDSRAQNRRVEFRILTE